MSTTLVASKIVGHPSIYKLGACKDLFSTLMNSCGQVYASASFAELPANRTWGYILESG